MSLSVANQSLVASMPFPLASQSISLSFPGGAPWVLISVVSVLISQNSSIKLGISGAGVDLKRKSFTA